MVDRTRCRWPPDPSEDRRPRDGRAAPPPAAADSVLAMPSSTIHRPAPLPDARDLDVIGRASAVAHAAVDGLRDRLLRGWGSAARRDKRDGSPVTDLDLLADRTIAAAVLDTFPDHSVVSEEGATTWDGAEWTWIVDPIDGTTNYAAGLPYWGTSVALAREGRVVWGMVDVPALGQRIEATRGAGTTLDGTPVRVRPASDLTDRATRHVPMAVSAGTIRQTAPGTFFKPRVLGAGAVDLALVASGTLGAAFMRVPKVWDVAAGTLCVVEAGGAVVEFDEPCHLPLEAGRDARDVSVRTIAGPDADWILDARHRLWPLR